MTTFGVDLKSHGDEIPYIVVKCVTELEKRGKCVKGLYRVSGVKSRVDKLCRSFEKGTEVGDLSEVHPNVIANVLKLYLRQLPEPLMTYKAYSEFIRIAKQFPSRTRPEEDTRLIDRIVSCLKEATSKLPLIHYQTLSYLCHHLKSIADNHHINNMPPSNLGIVFGPTLLRTREGPAGLCSLVDNVHQTRVVQLLITLAERVFGSPPMPGSTIHHSHHHPSHHSPSPKHQPSSISTSASTTAVPATVPSTVTSSASLSSFSPTKAVRDIRVRGSHEDGDDEDDEEDEEDEDEEDLDHELEYECIEEDVDPEPPREIRKSKSSIVVLGRDTSAPRPHHPTPEQQHPQQRQPHPLSIGADRIPTRPGHVIDLSRLRQYNSQPAYHTSTAVIKLSPFQASRLTSSSFIPSKHLQHQPQSQPNQPLKQQSTPPSSHPLQQSMSQSSQYHLLKLPQSQSMNLGLTRSSTMTTATCSTTMTSTSITSQHKPSLNELRRAFFIGPTIARTTAMTTTLPSTSTAPMAATLTSHPPLPSTQRLYRPMANASASSLISTLQCSPPSTSPSPSPSPSPTPTPTPVPTPSTSPLPPSATSLTKSPSTSTVMTSTSIQLRRQQPTPSGHLSQSYR